MFVCSQHAAAEQSYEWWSSTFSDCIRAVGHTLLVLQPWDDPLPLTRSWCLWEIFSTVSSNTPLDVLLSPAQAAALHLALVRARDCKRVGREV